MSVSARGSSSTARMARPELISHTPRGREPERDAQPLAGLAGLVGTVELEVEGVAARAQGDAHAPGLLSQPALERAAERSLDVARPDPRARQLARGRHLDLDAAGESGLLEAQVDAH